MEDLNFGGKLVVLFAIVLMCIGFIWFCLNVVPIIFAPWFNQPQVQTTTEWTTTDPNESIHSIANGDPAIQIPHNGDLVVGFTCGNTFTRLVFKQ